MLHENPGAEPRYRGTVARINHDGWAFIRRKSLTTPDGEPFDLNSTLDVFLHQDDCLDGLRIHELKLGDELEFQLADDDRRKNAFRAKRVRGAGIYPVVGGVELHFDERVIGHPVVPIRWCLKPEVLTKLGDDPDIQWGLVIIGQPVSAQKSAWMSSKTAIQTIVGLDNLSLTRGYLSFRRAGEHDVVAYLVYSKLGRKRFKARMSGIADGFDSRERLSIWNPDGIDINRRLNMEDLRTVAVGHVRLEVPDGIFAKPPSGWTKALLGYFRAKVDDECSMRRKVALAILPGVPLAFVWELMKRLVILLVGIFHFLFGGNPFVAWKNMLALRADVDLYEHDFKPMGKFNGWANLLRPVFPVVLLSLIASIWFFPGEMKAIGMIIGGLALLVMLGNLLTGGFGSSRRRYLAKVALVETYATCGTDATSSEGRMSIRLIYDGIKRRVCRTYG